MNLNAVDSDDDDDAPPETCSSQGVVESFDYRRDAATTSPTYDSRGKQPAAKSRDGVNVAAKNRHRQAAVMTSDVVTSSVTSESADDVKTAPPH